MCVLCVSGLDWIYLHMSSYASWQPIGILELETAANGEIQRVNLQETHLYKLYRVHICAFKTLSLSNIIHE